MIRVTMESATHSWKGGNEETLENEKND